MPSLPDLFLKRLQAILNSAEYERVVRSFECPRPAAFRIQKPGVDPAAVRQELENQGFVLKPVSWYPAAFVLAAGDLRGLQETACYQRGDIYIQGLSSMLAALILNPKPGETVLDMAAAPGSKASLLALLMQGEGELHVNEKIRPRYFKLRSVMHAQGFKNVRLSLKPGEWFGRFTKEKYDRILLDAPCSSEGRFLASVPKTFQYWSPRKIREMVHKQRNLFGAALAALKPGGTMVYATCTFAPEENEGVLDWAIDKYAGLMEVLEPDMPVASITCGLTGWEGQDFAADVSRARRILPAEEMEPFFMALVRKQG